MISCAMLRTANYPVGDGQGNQASKDCLIFMLKSLLTAGWRTGEVGAGGSHRLWPWSRAEQRKQNGGKGIASRYISEGGEVRHDASWCTELWG